MCVAVAGSSTTALRVRRHNPYVVHMLTQRGKAALLERVLRDGLNPNVARGDGCPAEGPETSGWAGSRKLWPA